MATASEELLARYRQVVRKADAFGRVIGVHRLNSMQKVRVLEMTDSSLDSIRAALLTAASVCEIDDDKLPFPKTRGELDTVFARLDDEGLAAAGIAIAELLGVGDESGVPADETDAAKK